MTMEPAKSHAVHKPWGSPDIAPWSRLGDGAPIGEVWFERAGASVPPALLLKLLFTSAPLSLQVHPDDRLAQSLGQQNGKTEAWYVLAARPDAKIAIGLTHDLPPEALRLAIDDGSIAALANWQKIERGQSVLVEAGSIHAIGAGLVIVEVQQRSDTTYRLFDNGSDRELHPDLAVSASAAMQDFAKVAPAQPNRGREVLAQSPYFVLERFAFEPGVNWTIDAVGEAWLLVVAGALAFDNALLAVGEAMFIEGDRAKFRAIAAGTSAVLAYVASAPIAGLITRNDFPSGATP
jgi:mannose-6-phosphate isomerase